MTAAHIFFLTGRINKSLKCFAKDFNIFVAKELSDTNLNCLQRKSRQLIKNSEKILFPALSFSQRYVNAIFKLRSINSTS